MSPDAALALVAGIASDDRSERKNWSGVAGFDWADDGSLDAVEEAFLAPIHTWAALLEGDDRDVREGLLMSLASLSVSGSISTPALERLLVQIPADALDPPEWDHWTDLADMVRDQRTPGAVRPYAPARALQAFADGVVDRRAIGPVRCMELLHALTSSNLKKPWCQVLDRRIDAGELDGTEIGAISAVLAWAAVVEADVEVRAAMLGSLLNLGRRRLLPALVVERLVEQLDPAGVDTPGAELLRDIAALPR